MAHWLIKSEPSVWSWERQVAAGAAGTRWDGVRNHSAKLNLMAMKAGEEAFFYHSNEGKAIVGVAKIIRAAYPDPAAKPGEPWVVVDVAASEAMPKPVTLAAIKAATGLENMALVKFSRLSVQPVSAAEWKIVRRMGGL